MKKYEKAEMEVVEFETEDVIANSGVGGGDAGLGEGGSED